MKIISWNVNSVRARIENIIHFLNSESIDCLLLQEIKCMDKDFPYETFEDLGYNCAVHGQKSYNGVAIISKYPLEDINRGIDGDDNIESRYIEACVNFDGKIFCVASIYVPNGRLVDSEYFEYKLKYFQRIKKQIELKLKLNESFIIGGDYNVAPEEDDVYDPVALSKSVGFHIKERKEFWNILSTGMIDSYRLYNPKGKAYSWWDYRHAGWSRNHGMRIDQILITPNIVDNLKSVDIFKECRGREKASDHVPIGIEVS